MTLGELGLLLASLGTAPYIYAIFRGTVRPSRASWFIWSLILCLAIWSYHVTGASDSIWFLVGDGIGSCTIFLLSLWRGMGGWSKTDIACLVLAGISLFLWQVSNITLFVLWGALIADSIALIPTIRKALDDPASEGASTYFFASLGAFCGLLAVGQWSMKLLFYPAYLFLANMTTALVVWVGQYQVARLQSAGNEEQSV